MNILDASLLLFCCTAVPAALLYDAIHNLSRMSGRIMIIKPKLVGRILVYRNSDIFVLVLYICYE